MERYTNEDWGLLRAGLDALVREQFLGDWIINHFIEEVSPDDTHREKLIAFRAKQIAADDVARKLFERRIKALKDRLPN